MPGARGGHRHPRRAGRRPGARRDHRPHGAWASLPERPLPGLALDPEDDATLFYTSGTTGKPKGAIGTHRAAASTVMAYPYSAARTALRKGVAPPRPDPNAPQRAALLAIPLFHVTACHASLGSALLGGTGW